MEDHPEGRRRQRGDDHRPLRPPRRRSPDGRPRRGRRGRPPPPRLRHPQPLRRRRQHAAHPRLGQPRADHHGAGRPRRRPAHHAEAAAASPKQQTRAHDAPTTAHRSPASPPPSTRFPTPEPEADGTLQWDATTAVTVTLTAGGQHRAGLDLLQPRRRRRHPRQPGRRRPRPRRPRHRRRLVGDAPRLPQPGHPRAGHAGHQRRRHRLVGPQGPAARRPALPALLGRCRSEVPIYGSGGFTTLTDTQLDGAESTGGSRSAAPR